MTAAVIVSRRAVLTGATLLSAGLAHGRTPNNHLGRTTMNIMRSGSQPLAKGPAEYFTGEVRIDMRFKGTAPARIGGAIVISSRAHERPGIRVLWARP